MRESVKGAGHCPNAGLSGASSGYVFAIRAAGEAPGDVVPPLPGGAGRFTLYPAGPLSRMGYAASRCSLDSSPPRKSANRPMPETPSFASAWLL